MAQLSEATKDELTADLQRLFSRHWYPIDITAAQLRTGIDIFDANMETCENNILNSVGEDARTWLINNATLGRFILEELAQKRREEL